MLRSILLFSLFFASNFAHSNNGFPISVKERLRIHLWTEGIKQPNLSSNQTKAPAPLIEELGRPLLKL